MADVDAALVETTVAGYRLKSVIAASADGSRVYSAVGDETGGPATVRLSPLADTHAAARFEADVAALTSIRDANVPTLLAHGEAPEGLYAVATEITGSELPDIIGEGLPPLRAVKLLGDVADALDQAHAAHLLHRAIRPANVIVEERPVERAFLTSFELGRSHEATDVSTDQLPYLSPEEARGESATPASDLYSFTCLLYEAVTGEPPFGRDPDAARRGHLSEEPTAASQRRPNLPPTLDAVLARGLAKAPADRYASAGELMSAAARTAFDMPGAGAPAQTSPMPEPEVTLPVPAIATDPMAAEAMPAVATDPMVAEAMPAIAPESPATLELPPLMPAEPSAPPARVAGWVMVLLLAVAASLGWLAAGALNGDDGPDRAAGNGVDLVVPAGWSESVPPTGLADLAGNLPLAYRPSAAAKSGLIAGLVPGERILIDPRILAARVQSNPPRPEAVTLGSLKAWRWNGLRTQRPGRVLNLYAAPTSAGTAVVACYTARGGDTPSACNDAAGSLRVPGGRVFNPAEGAVWRANVLKATATLSRRRRALRSQLVRARGPAAQGRAARAIAAAHTGALTSIERGGVPEQAAAPHTQISGALKALAGDYNRLARAATRRNRAAFRRAQGAIARDDGRLRIALRRI